MTFTDNDLTRLKADIDMAYSCNGLAYLKGEKLNSLLFRLEAAEKVCEHMAQNVYIEKWPMLKEWRKAAGK